ncbi:UPF0223 family protein [Planococcus lenghuensis]|uniref:Uncharacterized protein n=1 Tax=Planococcus lenghuensis TaxID=2213202 RepID=A0A1Q2L1T2_9BACL|nr:UPF0223 family protein [Planococcus lenghuensis]AQQ53842.1 hypothetical protein B0X71_12585 [Planococcus lenghuensis]
MEYAYPLSTDWSTGEIVQVIEFFEGIELAYEKGIAREDMMDRYRRFKDIVPSMAEEKTLLREFEEVSGYAGYPVIKQMKASQNGEKLKVSAK